MSEELANLKIKEVKAAILNIIYQCSRRGLFHTTKWFAELSYSLRHVQPETSVVTPDDSEQSESETYTLAKSYFDVKEYDRCAFFSSSCSSSCGRFLHYYSKYLSIDRKRLERGEDSSNETTVLASLSHELAREYAKGSLDAYLLYLYGLMLKRLDLLDLSRTILCEAVTKEPMLWCAWLQLSSIINDRSELKPLTLPDHWMKQFFLAHVYVELQLGDEALQLYSEFERVGFQQSSYILAQTAIALHNKRDVDESIATFQELRKLDPYRLENMDTYSNLLYIKEMRKELAYLAQHAVEVDKYRVETCCLIGNYYGLRGEHPKAVAYFQRALKLNPHNVSAWTLMGHEYMEIKNTNAAIQCYRRAIEVNRRDYRAWYGLGQTYEILRMPLYSCYYYKEAQALRPNDSRMLTALGETYEKLDRFNDAIKCFYKARSVGDVDANALLKMAKLFERQGSVEEATTAYTDFVTENESAMTESNPELCHAYKYLANIHLKNNRLPLAFQFAQKCLSYEETKEEGKALLRTIAQKRGHEEEKLMQTEDADQSGPRGDFHITPTGILFPRRKY